MKFICRDCGEYFSDFDAGEHCVENNEVGRGQFSTFVACPVCGSENIADAVECKMCGTPSFDEVCDACSEKFSESLNNFIEEQRKIFNSVDRDTIADLINSWLEHNI